MKKLLLIGVLLLTNSAFAAGVPASFTYQGIVMNSAGTAPLTSVVSLKLSIYDPTAACLLYQEQQSNIDLSQTNGTFAIQVGSATGAAKRTSADQGLAMTAVFANNGQILAASTSNCTAGYTPAANDSRILRVAVTNGGSTVTISPDLQINSVPNAMVAETVQGLNVQGLTQQITPPGVVVSYAGATCPSGYVAADGSTYPTTGTYSNLFAAIQYTYGGTGSSFNVPNTGGAFIRGSGNQTIGGVSYTGTQGTTQGDQIQGHVHARNTFGLNEQVNIYPNVGNGPSGAFQAGNQVSTYATTGLPATDGTNGTPRTGGETRPANIVLKYCIKY
jgi:hypothetical protein